MRFQTQINVLLNLILEKDKLKKLSQVNGIFEFMSFLLMYTAKLTLFMNRFEALLYLQITQKYLIKIFVNPGLFVIWEYRTDGINVDSFIKIEKNMKISSF
jgi:hypothetical protein